MQTQTNEIPSFEGLTFDKVWTALMENRKQMKETDRRMKETDKLVTRVTKQIGELHNTFGELAEHLVAPGIANCFNRIGYHFDAVLPGGHRILDKNGEIKTEIDMLLENTEYIIAVEVKVKPKIQDIEHHIKRLKILREHRSKHNDRRKILGVFAGAIFGIMEKRAFMEAGLYVLEQSGDTMKLIIPDGFTPVEW